MFGDLFSYESKIYQLLVRLSQYVFLNVLFLLCCIPVVTIGAAQAGLMNAVRTMQDPTDDRSCYKAFFRGLASGFWKITAIWCILMVLIGAMLYVLFMAIYFDAIWENAPVLPALIGLGVCMLLQAMTAAFHSRFDCSLWQILRSAWYMILMHPVRALVMTALMWGPVIVALLDLYVFFQVTPLWMFGYFGIAYPICTKLMDGPFREIEDQFVKAPQEEGREITEEIV